MTHSTGAPLTDPLDASNEVVYTSGCKLFPQKYRVCITSGTRKKQDYDAYST